MGGDMRYLGRVLAFGALAAALALGGTTEVLAQKKKVNTNSNSNTKTTYPLATDADYAAIQKQKELFGKLVTVDTGALTLRVSYQQYASNPKYKAPKNSNSAMTNQQNQLMRTYNNLMQEMQRAATSRTPQQAMQHQQRMQQDMIRWQQQYQQFVTKYYQTLMKMYSNPNNMPFVVVTNTKDFDLAIEDKAVYRKLNLPFEYDDTGNVKTYTDKEKADLRGSDKSKPGYTAKYEDLQAGQDVELFLTAPPPAKKSADAVDMPPAHPTVHMIVITKDNGTTSSVPQPSTGTKQK